MGFLDKLRGQPHPEPELSAWLEAVMQRLEPSRIRFQPGETLGQVFARVFDEEEAAVRAGGGDAALRERKLQALAALREQFPMGDTPAKEATMGTPGEAPAAGYEMVLGGEQELSGAPMSMLLQLLSGWQKVVNVIGRGRGVPEEQLADYRSVVLRTDPGAQGDELVVVFVGTKEMVDTYRGKLREAGIETN